MEQTSRVGSIVIVVSIAINNGKNTEDKPEPHSFNLSLYRSDEFSKVFDEKP